VTILAHGDWKTNAELIRDCASLGYLHGDWYTLDPTYGLGTFWSLWRPHTLVASDIDPAKSLWGGATDFTNLPWSNNLFDAVVFDPPYKLNGTPDADRRPAVRRSHADEVAGPDATDPRRRRRVRSRPEAGRLPARQVSRPSLFRAGPVADRFRHELVGAGRAPQGGPLRLPHLQAAAERQAAGSRCTEHVAASRLPKGGSVIYVMGSLRNPAVPQVPLDAPSRARRVGGMAGSRSRGR
jgi:hypothetical protein